MKNQLVSSRMYLIPSILFTGLLSGSAFAEEGDVSLTPKLKFSTAKIFQDIEQSPAVGLDLDYGITDDVSVGLSADWARYHSSTRTRFDDLSLGLNAKVGIYKGLYGLVGISSHYVSPKIEGSNYDKTHKFLNGDLGLGYKVNLADSIDLDVAYKFSDSIRKTKVDGTKRSLQKHEASIGLSMWM